MDTTTLIGLISLSVAIIGLLITIVEKWKIITSKVLSLYRLCICKISSLKLDLSRRKFITTGIIVGAGSILAFLFKFPSIKPPAKPNKWSKYSFEKKFIVNKKNGVIHFKEICKDHLPVSHTSVSNPVSSHLHGSKQQKITKAVLPRLPDKLKEELLIDAIKKSPTSTHLYKYLIKQWGRNKEYPKIHSFVSINIKYIESKLINKISDKKKVQIFKSNIRIAQ